MKVKISTVTAWVLFGLLASMALAGIIYAFSANRNENQNLLTLISAILWGFVPLVFAFLAALVLSRQPGNVIGWLLMLPAIALANDATFHTYFESFSSAPVAPTIWFLLTLWFYNWSWLLLIFPVFFISLLFPTGRPASPFWRWVTFYILGVVSVFFIFIALQNTLVPQNVTWLVKNPVGFISSEWFQKYGAGLFFIGLPTSTVLSAAAIFYRYRRAASLEREQIKWLLYACVFFAVIYLTAILSNINSKEWGSSVFNLLAPFALMALPIAITIAILRYHLWDIDVIIRRTLIYSSLTVVLGLVFFGGVTIIQQLFGAVTGLDNSPAAIVISTLAIAALFNPLRNSVQNFIDRRFYRQKYDAEQALACFASAARQETDLARLSAELVTVTQDAMQPEQVSLWLAKTKDRK